MHVNPAKTGAKNTQIFLISMGRKRASKVHFAVAAVPMIPGKIVPPMTRPRGYHDSESYQFQKEYQPSATRYLVVRKLNHGSNSWMTDSYRITEKIRTIKASRQIKAKMLSFMTGERERRYAKADSIVISSSSSCGEGKDCVEVLGRLS